MFSRCFFKSLICYAWYEGLKLLRGLVKFCLVVRVSDSLTFFVDVAFLKVWMILYWEFCPRCVHDDISETIPRRPSNVCDELVHCMIDLLTDFQMDRGAHSAFEDFPKYVPAGI